MCLLFVQAFKIKMSNCIKCGRELSDDDIGLHKKLVNRGAKEFMCIDCLCSYFGMSKEKALKMIKNYKESGCVLFVK